MNSVRQCVGRIVQTSEMAAKNKHNSNTAINNILTRKYPTEKRSRGVSKGGCFKMPRTRREGVIRPIKTSPQLSVLSLDVRFAIFFILIFGRKFLYNETMNIHYTQKLTGLLYNLLASS